VLFVFLICILCAISLAGFVDFHVWCPVRVQEQFSGALFRACPNPFFAALVFLSARSQLRSATGVLIFFGLSLHRPTCFSRLIFHSRFVSLYRLNFVCASWPGPDPASRARSFFDFRYRNRSTWQIPRSGPICFLISANRSPVHRSIFSPASRPARPLWSGCRSPAWDFPAGRVHRSDFSSCACLGQTRMCYCQYQFIFSLYFLIWF
jgi:hypothetical protein